MKKLSMVAMLAAVAWMLRRGKKQERRPEQAWQTPVGAAVSDTSPSGG